MMPMYNLTEYGNNYSKTSESLPKCYRDEPNGTLSDSESFKYKVKIAGNATAPSNTKDVTLIAAALNYLINAWITLEILPIHSEINHFLV